MRRKVSALLLAGTMLFSGAATIKAETPISQGQEMTYQLPAISLYVNEKKVETTTMHPVQIEGRVLVPIREVFEAMHASVQWHAASKTVTIQYKNTTVLLTVNDKKAMVNGMAQYMDVPAQHINGKVMIPVRFVSEALGMSVVWKGTDRSVWIKEPVTNIPEQTTGPSYTGNMNKHELTVPEATYDRSSISSVTVDSHQGEAVATVNAQSPISKVNITLMPGKVIIDVKNSTSLLASKIPPAENTYVAAIRTSQFTADTTRIVLDLKSGALVTATLSDDRKALRIALSSQHLEEATLLSDQTQDKIFLKGITNSQVILTENKEMKTIQFRIPNMKINRSINWQKIESSIVSSLTMVQEERDVVGTIHLKEEATFSMKNIETGLHIVLQQGQQEETEDEVPTVPEEDNETEEEIVPPGLTYELGSYPVISLHELSGLQAAAISVTDHYRSRQIIFDLGKDYSHILKSETKTINDGAVKSIQVATHQTTKITVNTSVIYAYDIVTAKEDIELRLVRPSEKYDQIVVIDIGHGGADSGAVANNVKEKDINFKQGMALYRLLEADDQIKVYMTRETDTYPTLQFRSTLANEIEADLFISIHNNSASSSIVGTETLYYPSSTDLRGKRVAQIVQDSIVSRCKMVNRGIKARKDLHVLKATQMPAILIETGFLSNAEEAARINSPSHIATWSKAVYDAIVQGFKEL